MTTAMLVAPAIGMALVWGLFFAASWITPGEKPIALGEIVSGSLAIAVISAPVLYPLAWLLGVPAHLTLVRRGWTGYHHYALAGVATGLVGALLVGMTGLGATFAAFALFVAPIVALLARAIVGDAPRPSGETLPV